MNCAKPWLRFSSLQVIKRSDQQHAKRLICGMCNVRRQEQMLWSVPAAQQTPNSSLIVSIIAHRQLQLSRTHNAPQRHTHNALSRDLRNDHLAIQQCRHDLCAEVAADVGDVAVDYGFVARWIAS